MKRFFKTWLKVETPNIFYEVYPSASTMPGVYPMFDPSDRVKTMALMSTGVELMNKPITKQVTTTGEIKSTVLVNSYEGNGEIDHVRWYGGILAISSWMNKYLRKQKPSLKLYR